MHTASLDPTPAAIAMATHPRGRGLGILLIAEALLSLAPVAILGAAFGWPASLDRPAAEQLSAIAANPRALQLGYGLYLLYSVLIAPTMIWLAARCLGGLQQPLAATVAAFGALSALARAIGILRWLTVMPALATAHATADPQGRAQIEQLFDAVTLYGGGIGELLGVSLLMAASVGLLSVGALLRGGLPRPLAALGVVSAALLAGLALPSLGVAVDVPVSAAVSVLSLWMLLCGGWCLWSARRQRSA
jgi:hypothetical protein